MTPVYKINTPHATIWAKLESRNPTGTHKDRSMRPWISHYAKQGIEEFAIASSGNSAIAAAKYCAEKRLGLHVFVSPDSLALPRLREAGANLHVTKTPRRDAIQFCRDKKILNLRASTDDLALIGYRKIAFELIKQLAQVDNIFIPTSSGATLEGLHEGMLKALPPPSAAGECPAFFAIQTAKVHPIAGYFDKNFARERASHAAAIVDNIAHRRDRIIKICKETGGGGFVISNRELEEARDMLCGVSDTPHIGWQSALAFAGFLKWRAQNPPEAMKKISVCLFTD